VPVYGRSFLNTEGPGTPFSGLSQGSWESGVYDYRAFTLPGPYVLRDERVLASWTYDYGHKEMISFDEVVGRSKGEYIYRPRA
jgi:chitinase